MNAIQGLRSALEEQIETVSIDPNLLQADLRNVSEKVNTAETNIGTLQGNMASLKKQTATVRAEATAGKSREGKRYDTSGRGGAPIDPGDGPRGRRASTTHETQLEEDDTMYMSKVNPRGRPDRSSGGSPAEGLLRATGHKPFARELEFWDRDLPAFRNFAPTVDPRAWQEAGCSTLADLYPGETFHTFKAARDTFRLNQGQFLTYASIQHITREICISHDRRHAQDCAASTVA
ncbi:hypothetical protein NDU88_002063 [Pleurodeles waltl]|uniref:Uncharacterized protein n=1 Tax=Pleurodeles waltl TaxID=8319 RepID=A0AAV7NGX7_PLEWA|nr:hypothetical protein NDU88_002063 [Pleurodeles waltl]